MQNFVSFCVFPCTHTPALLQVWMSQKVDDCTLAMQTIAAAGHGTIPKDATVIATADPCVPIKLNTTASGEVWWHVQVKCL